MTIFSTKPPYFLWFSWMKNVAKEESMLWRKSDICKLKYLSFYSLKYSPNSKYIKWIRYLLSLQLSCSPKEMGVLFTNLLIWKVRILLGKRKSRPLNNSSASLTDASYQTHDPSRIISLLRKKNFQHKFTLIKL